jgi:hypothetical protein
VAVGRLSARWRTGQSGAHRTVRCPLPRHHCRWILTVGAPDLWARLGVRCTPDSYCLLSGVPSWARLTSARAARAFIARQRAVGAEIAVAPELHRTVRCTPDSPVNYSRVASGNSRRCEFESESPWCTGHVRWHTGQSGAPDQGCLRLPLCSFVESKTWSFYWLSVNLLHLYNLYTWAN